MVNKAGILEAAFSDIRFNEAEHRYFLESSDVRFLSATSVISAFSEKFDADGAASAYVQNRPGQGLDEQTVKWEWQENGKYAAQVGSDVHGFAEHYERVDMSDFECYEQHSQWFHRVKRYYEVFGLPLLRELKLYDIEFGCGGMADMIYDADGMYEIDIRDWKSTHIKSYDVAFAGRKMMMPFDYLDDCKKSKQTLQLNVYRRIIEMNTPLRVRNMTVIMLRYEEKSGLPVSIDLPRISDEHIDQAMLMLARGEQPQYRQWEMGDSLFSF